MHPCDRLARYDFRGISPSLVKPVQHQSGRELVSGHSQCLSQGRLEKCDQCLLESGLLLDIGLLPVGVATEPALLILLFLARKRREGLQAVRRLWLLWTPSAIACLAYSLVLVEPRYVVSFLSILWIAAFSVVAAVDRKQATRLWMAVVLAVASMTSLKLAKSMFSDLITAVSPQTNINSQIAEALRGLGISNGDKVAGVSLAANTHWARLAGVTVVAEIPLGEETNLWSASPQLQATVFHKLADIGAKLAVARDAPPSALAAGWFPLGATGYWAHRLPMRSPELPGP